MRALVKSFRQKSFEFCRLSISLELESTIVVISTCVSLDKLQLKKHFIRIQWAELFRTANSLRACLLRTSNTYSRG